MKRVLTCLLLLLVILTFAGCSSAKIETQIGKFSFARMRLFSTYGDLSAPAGQQLLTLEFDGSEIQEANFSTYFVGDQTYIELDGTTYPCTNVAVQGSAGSDAVEYVLIFCIPQSITEDTLDFNLVFPDGSIALKN